MTGKRGIINLTELPPIPPCSETLWEDSRFNDWDFLKGQILLAEGSARLTTQLHLMMTECTFGNNLSLSAKKIFGQVMGRILWEHEELDIILEPYIPDFCSSSETTDRRRTKLLQGLYVLRNSLSNLFSATGIIHHR